MIRVFIADDHVLIREGLRQLLRDQVDLTVEGEAETTATMIDEVSRIRPDILIMDLTMPGKPGLEVLQDLRLLCPRMRVLVLTMHPEDSLAVRALRAGAAGYITKDAVAEELLRAIRKVAAGGKYVSATLAERLADALDVTSEKPPHETLSDREFQVFILIAKGKSIAEIAAALAISPATVNTYRARLLDKMHVSSNVELIHYALRNTLIEPLG